ncbi:MAG: hypothetical protein IID35_10610, partial [Planctomycetes bacterium]|nr:hypothetical protein [Planctomycetota bacterium]
ELTHWLTRIKVVPGAADAFGVPEAERVRGESVNLACGDRITINEVIASINKILGTSIDPLYVDERPGDVRHSCADIRLVKELLGFEPVVTFDDGLKRAIEYYRALA